MWSYYPELLATPVPRYTSYPTAAEFHEGVGEREHRAALGHVGVDEPLSLYVHIPYCHEICWYCGCNTGAANRTQRLASYLERLGQEIDLVASLLAGRGRVERLSFGGGSPNAISADQFGALVRRIADAFAIHGNAILSVEIDPRGFDAAFAEAMARAGVRRASLGVQTLSAQVQAAIGRIQPAETIEKATGLLRAAGVESLNFDLMYGLPGQGGDDLLSSIAASAALGADRLAVFGYAHVPHLVPRQRRIDAAALPDAEARFRHAWLAHDALVGRGWTAVGFDHFARPHDPLAAALLGRRVRRNFQGFTDDRCDTLIGLGASAISRLPRLLAQNERNSGRYGMMVGTRHSAVMRGIAVNADERRRARAIESLLCHGTADMTGHPEAATARDALAAFEERGLVEWTGPRLTLAPEALPYARAIAAALDPWRTTSAIRFSSAI